MGQTPAIPLPERVEIHRTEYGVPHILADDLEAMGFGLGYVQSEDYGASIAVAMVTSLGTLARHLGADELDAAFAGRAVHARAVETFHRLEPRTAFGIIGGFNARLGWATTNNYPTLSQVYKLSAHPTLDDHALLDGRPLPLERRDAIVDYRTAAGGTATEARTTWCTPYGPVIHRTDEHVYLLKDPRDGEFRRGEQLLRMMMAQDLDEWLDVMKMRAHRTSNFTYADRDGNIAHYYNVRLPLGAVSSSNAGRINTSMGRPTRSAGASPGTPRVRIPLRTA